MATPRRTRLSPDARREQLLDLGLELLSERTLDELSIDLLAEKAGISRGLLFHYFKNKSEFHREVVRRAADDLVQRTAPDLTQDHMTQMVTGLQAYIQYVIDNYAAYINLVRGAGSGSEELREIFEATRDEIAQRMVDGIVELGVPATPRAHLFARGALAFAEEVVLTWVPNKQMPRADLETSLATALLAIMQAFAPPVETAEQREAAAARAHHKVGNGLPEEKSR